MAEGRGRMLWDQTSLVTWMLYSVNRGPKSPPKTPADFNPFAAPGKSQQSQVDKVPMKVVLAGLFGSKKVNDGG